MKRERKARWRLLLVLFLTFAVLQTPFTVLNTPRFQQWFLKTYKPFAPWQISFETLKVKPWRLRLDLAGLKMVHPAGHHIEARTIGAKASVLALLRGRIGVDSLKVNSPTITLAKMADTQKKEKGKFKIRTLLFLQNLVLDDGALENASLHLPDGKRLSISLFGIEIKPALLKGTGLHLDLKNIQFAEPFGGTRQMENIKVSVTTHFGNWSKTFPYIDDIDGDFHIDETQIGKFRIREADAQLRLEKGKITSKKFAVAIGKSTVMGQCAIDLNTQQFSLNVEAPEAITLPEMDDEHRTFNTAGRLTATVRLEGKNFDPSQSQGKGSVTARHVFAGFEDHPAEAAFAFEWGGGKIDLKEAKVFSDNAAIEAQGSIDLKPFSLHLKLRAADFPIGRFFEKFEDKNLHPIHGRGTVEATLDGIAKTIHLQLSGEAVEGGYGPLKAEKARVNLDITYPQLKLDGIILTGDKKTGEARFTIDYGAKQPGKPRPKNITLHAAFNGQPLDKTLPGFYLAGGIDGTFNLKGAIPDGIHGEGNLTATQGSFFDEGFEAIRAHFSLTPKKLIVDKADFLFSNLQSSFTHPLTFDFTPGGFRLWGQPVSALQIDVVHTSEDKRWQIKKLLVEDPANPELKTQVSGSFSPESMDLRGIGNLELGRLKFLTHTLRDAAGPAEFSLALRGKTPDLSLHGHITFQRNLLFLRAYPYSAEDLVGTLRFDGNRISTDNLEGFLGNGTFNVVGWMTHTGGKPSGFDAKIRGRQLYYRGEDGKFRMEFDTDLSLKGSGQNPELEGTLTILDGRYIKNFNIIEELKAAPTAAREIRAAAREATPIRLDLAVKNLGDLLIDNNVGRIELNADVRVGGTQFDPRVEGTVTATEGEIHYLGLNFEITRGFIEFRTPNANPYLEVDAEQDVGEAHIVAKLHGYTDNLAMDLSGTTPQEGALEKKDVLSLLIFGATTTERYQRRSIYEEELGPEVAAEQIARLLQRPIAGATGLDVFRMETTPSEEGRVRRFELGKQINDRLIVELASELKQDLVTQYFQLEYMLTDFFVLKGARSTDESYRTSAGFKFKSR